MGYLTRKEILAAQDIKTQDVAVPEWGGVVRVRGLSGAERDRFESTFITLNGTNATVTLEGMRAHLVAMTVIDEAGNLLFSPGDVEALGAKSSGALDRVFTAAQTLSGLTKADVEALAKNSGSGPSAASTSD